MIRAALLILALLLASAAGAQPLRIAVISDLNSSYGSTDYAREVGEAVARIVALRPDLVISTGDMVAGQRRNPPLTAAEIDAMWEAFDHAVVAPLKAAGIPLLATPGNHDASAYPGFEAERAAYARIWRAVPSGVEMVDASAWPFRYAVAQAGVLFVSLDVTTIGAPPPDDHAWLRDLLRREGHRRAVVVFSHLPVWPFAEGRATEIADGTALTRLFTEGGVELHLSGHHHAYYSGVHAGVRYVAQACLGGGPRRLIGASERSRKGITLIEIGEDGTIDEMGLSGDDLQTPIDMNELPPAIPAPWGTLIRRDLAP